MECNLNKQLTFYSIFWLINSAWRYLLDENSSSCFSTISSPIRLFETDSHFSNNLNKKWTKFEPLISFFWQFQKVSKNRVLKSANGDILLKMNSFFTLPAALSQQTTIKRQWQSQLIPVFNQFRSFFDLVQFNEVKNIANGSLRTNLPMRTAPANGSCELRRAPVGLKSKALQTWQATIDRQWQLQS